MFCMELIAFPVTLHGCDCDAGANLCYECWEPWAKSNDAQCPVCKKPKVSCVRNKLIEEMVEQILNRGQDLEAMSRWSKRRDAGLLLWKDRNEIVPNEVSIAVSGSLKTNAAAVAAVDALAPLRDEGESTNQVGGGSDDGKNTEADDRNVETAAPQKGKSCVDANTSGVIPTGDTRNVIFPAGNGNFGMRLALDVITEGDERVPQHVVVSDVSDGGTAQILGLRPGDRLVSFRGHAPNAEPVAVRTFLPKWTITSVLAVKSTAERVRIQNMLERTAEALKQVVSKSDCIVTYTHREREGGSLFSQLESDDSVDLERVQ